MLPRAEWIKSASQHLAHCYRMVCHLGSGSAIDQSIRGVRSMVAKLLVHWRTWTAVCHSSAGHAPPRQSRLGLQGKLHSTFGCRLRNLCEQQTYLLAHRFTLGGYKGSSAALVAYETTWEKISLLIPSVRSVVVAGGEEVRSGDLTFHYRGRANSQVIT